MDTKNFKTLFDEIIKEEVVKKDNNYINSILIPQSASLLRYLMKFEYLLPKEEQQQDKNHWKCETYSVLNSLIKNLGAIKSEQLILNGMNSSITKGHKLILLELKNKYNSLLNPKNYTIEMTENLAKKYFPIISKWLFSSYKDVLKEKIDSEKCARDFVNKLFE